jgi:hypothetical protein
MRTHVACDEKKGVNLMVSWGLAKKGRYDKWHRIRRRECSNLPEKREGSIQLRNYSKAKSFVIW